MTKKIHFTIPIFVVIYMLSGLLFFYVFSKKMIESNIIENVYAENNAIAITLNEAIIPLITYSERESVTQSNLQKICRNIEIPNHGHFSIVKNKTELITYTGTDEFADMETAEIVLRGTSEKIHISDIQGNTKFEGVLNYQNSTKEYVTVSVPVSGTSYRIYVHRDKDLISSYINLFSHTILLLGFISTFIAGGLIYFFIIRYSKRMHKLSTSQTHKIEQLVNDLRSNQNKLALLETNAEQNENMVKDNNEKLIAILQNNSRLTNLLSDFLIEPLNTILTYSDLLKNKELNMNDNDKTIVNIVNSTALETYHLTKKLLLWGKLKNKSLTLQNEKIQLSELINNIIGVFTDQIKEKEISIKNKVKNDMYISADNFVIRKALKNLLNNCILSLNKFGIIEITAQNVMVAKQSTLTVLQISDTATKYLEINTLNYFDLFDSGSVKTVAEKDALLSIILTKELIEYNNGKVIMETSNNKGRVCKIYLLPEKEN